MSRSLWLGLWLIANLQFVAQGASAQEGLCGPAPALPDVLQKDEAIKGQLQGQADFLSKFVGKAELAGQVEATRKQLYQNSNRYFAAQKDAYLSYLFCLVIQQDKTTPTLDKLKALQTFKDSAPSGQSSTATPSKPVLLSKYKEVLKTINLTTRFRSKFVIPALDDYIANPTPDRWDDVVNVVERLKDQIEQVLALTLDYDANFFTSASGLVSFVDFVDQETPRTSLIMTPVFDRTEMLQSANSDTVRRILAGKSPTVAQAIEWRDQLKQRMQLLNLQLEKLVELIGPG
jgi:hypothetical protein